MPPVPDRQPAKQMVQSTGQWGGRTHKAGGRDLDGRTWDQMPSTGPPEARDDRHSARGPAAHHHDDGSAAHNNAGQATEPAGPRGATPA